MNAFVKNITRHLPATPIHFLYSEGKGKVALFLGAAKNINEVNQVIIENIELKDIEPTGVFMTKDAIVL